MQNMDMDSSKDWHAHNVNVSSLQKVFIYQIYDSEVGNWWWEYLPVPSPSFTPPTQECPPILPWKATLLVSGELTGAPSGMLACSISITLPQWQRYRLTASVGSALHCHAQQLPWQYKDTACGYGFWIGPWIATSQQESCPCVNMFPCTHHSYCQQFWQDQSPVGRIIFLGPLFSHQISSIIADSADHLFSKGDSWSAVVCTWHIAAHKDACI